MLPNGNRCPRALGGRRDNNIGFPSLSYSLVSQEQDSVVFFFVTLYRIKVPIIRPKYLLLYVILAFYPSGKDTLKCTVSFYVTELLESSKNILPGKSDYRAQFCRLAYPAGSHAITCPLEEDGMQPYFGK